MDRPKILIVDDDEMFISSIKLGYSQSYEIIGTPNFKEALQSMDKYRFAAVILADQEYSQPSVDLLRALLSANTQVVLHQLCGCLPVRSDLLEIESFVFMGFPEPVARFALEALGQSELPGCPHDPGYKHNIDSLFLELWLGLDGLENICQRFPQL